MGPILDPNINLGFFAPHSWTIIDVKNYSVFKKQKKSPSCYLGPILDPRCSSGLLPPYSNNSRCRKLFNDEEKMSGLSSIVLNYTTKLKFGLFFPSHPSSSSGTTRCLQPTKKKGGGKNEREKNWPQSQFESFLTIIDFSMANVAWWWLKIKKPKLQLRFFWVIIKQLSTLKGVEKIKHSNSNFVAKFCVVKFKLIFFSPKKSKLKLESSRVLSTKKKTRKREEEKT